MDKRENKTFLITKQKSEKHKPIRKQGKDKEN